MLIKDDSQLIKMKIFDIFFLSKCQQKNWVEWGFSHCKYDVQKLLHTVTISSYNENILHMCSEAVSV